MAGSVRTEPSLQELPGDDYASGEALRDQAPMRRTGRRRRRRVLRWTLIALIGALALAAIVSMLLRPTAHDTPRVTAPGAPRAEAEPPAAPRYPIEPVAAALPPLDASDAALLTALQAVFADGGGIASFVEARDIVRNFVVTVDNLPRKTLARERIPLKQPAGAFAVSRVDNVTLIGSANAQRYRPHVALLEAADMTKLVQLYVRNYPLFQQAYRELGYPDGHFNDRLVEAIDTLIAAPDLSGNVRLVQPKIFYEFADHNIEALPAGQKLMVRMGSDNATRVKKRLIELRRLVTAQAAAR